MKPFDSANSTTCVETGVKQDLVYGEGECKGNGLTDTISIQNMTVTNQYFVLVTKMTQVSNFLGDGLLGMGYASLSDGHKTLLDNLYNQN